jgi:hypothetical protein
VPARRLDDKIRELRDKARAAQSAHELGTIIADLRSALREHNKRLRERVALTLVGRDNGFSQEKRASSLAQPESRAQNGVQKRPLV